MFQNYPIAFFSPTRGSNELSQFIKIKLPYILRILLIVLPILHTPIPALPTDQDTLFNAYPFLSRDHNYIQFYNKTALKKFYRAWMKSPERKFTVLHIGDSHLQNDVFPGRIRSNLQEILGYGGRGMMFSYSAAGTYSNRGYKTEHSGFWVYSKNTQSNPVLPLGVPGMTVKTEEPESSLSFLFKEPEPEHYRSITLFLGPMESGFGVIVGDDTTYYEPKKVVDVPHVYKVLLPNSTKRITLQVREDKIGAKEIHFYGMSLESIQDSGVIWHNAGVDGANLKSILRSSLFFQHAAYLNPDLVVLDLGTNEYAATDTIPDSLLPNMDMVVKHIKKYCKKASIILNSTQDMSFRGKNLESTERFISIQKKIAKKYNTGFYDFYSVAGGRDSMKLWFANELSHSDLIHLVDKGYHLKGDLYTYALLNTIDVLQNSRVKSLISSE